MNSLASGAAVNKYEGKIIGKGAARGGKGFILFILNEDKNITNIIKSLEDSNVLIDCVTKTVQHEIKNKEVFFFLLC